MTHYKQTFTCLTLAILAGFLMLIALPPSKSQAQLQNCQGALDAGSEGQEEGTCVEPEPPVTKTCNGTEISVDAVCPYKDSAAINNEVHYCGQGETQIVTAIDFGCTEAYPNGILDLVMAILRFLTNMVGVVLIGATMWAGIQYGVSRGDPNMVTGAKKRLFNVFLSLVIFLFSYVIINFLVPGFFS